MRVLVGIPCLLTGGTEIQTLSLVQALIESGHEVIVSCYFEFDQTMVSRFESIGAKVILFSPDNQRVRKLQGIIKLLYSNFKKIIKNFKPDVAHVQYMSPGAIPIIMLRILGLKKIIATTHTPADIYSPMGLKILKLLTRHILSGLQCITLLAEKSYFGTAKLFEESPLQNRVKASYLKKDNHFTIYNALSSHISFADNPKSFNNKVFTIGVVSRLTHIKGMDLVIPAFIDAKQQYQHMRLLIIGDGDQLELMKKQAETSTYNKDIEFYGKKPQEELEGYYDKIDILLMPSRSEGFGLTAIEGMARGCVVVAADVGGLSEVVNENVGLLHESENIKQISEAILHLVNNRNLLLQYSINAEKRAGEFSFNRYKQSIDKLYFLLENRD